MAARLTRARGALNVFGRVLPAQARDAIGTLIDVVEQILERVQLIDARQRDEGK
jgi:hypothetical protein